MRILVIGGTQFFGKLIVEQFLARSDQVTIFSRGRRRAEFWDAVEHIPGDRNDHTAFVRTLQQRSFDAVIDNIAFERKDVEAAIRAFAGRVGRYVLTTSGSVYATGRRFDAVRRLAPIREEDADLAYRDQDAYGDGKRACEETLHAKAGRARDLPFTIIRPPVVQGPEDPTGRVWFFVQRIADGGPLLVPTTFPTPATRHVYSADLARAFLAAVDTPAAADQTYNIAMEELVSLSDYVRLLSQAMKRDVEIVEVPEERLREDRTLGSYRVPFGTRRAVPDIRRAQHDLGWRSTPILDWLRVTTQWLLDNQQADSDGYKERHAEIKAAERWRRP